MSPLSVMRFESFLGVITSLFLLIAVAWMALGRVPWTASMKLFRGHADLTDERASTIRHLLTSRVYIGLLVGLLVNIAVVIYYGSLLHNALASMDAPAEGAGGGDVDAVVGDATAACAATSSAAVSAAASVPSTV